MTPDQARATLEAAFSSAWASATPILWANDSRPAPTVDYVEVTVAHNGGRLESWSGPNKTYRRQGLVIVKACTAPGTGTGRATQLAYQAISTLEGRKFGDAECLTGGLRDGGNRADGSGRFVQLATVRFEYTETRSG